MHFDSVYGTIPLTEEGTAMPNSISESQLRYMEFIHRENDDRHHTNTEDMYQYDLLRLGDDRAVEESIKMFSSDLPGHLSDDELRNFKYRFVASIALASRAAISGGLDSERALNISDLFIQRMDRLASVEDVKALHAEMFAFYVGEMKALGKKNVFSKPVTVCIDYIYNHLHEPIRVADLAALVGLNESYLSTLFKKETGRTISDYVLSKRLEAAENMLKFSNFPYAEIGAILAFSSQSHFIRTFKKATGLTPREYRNKYFVATPPDDPSREFIPK